MVEFIELLNALRIFMVVGILALGLAIAAMLYLFIEWLLEFIESNVRENNQDIYEGKPGKGENL